MTPDQEWVPEKGQRSKKSLQHQFYDFPGDNGIAGTGNLCSKAYRQDQIRNFRSRSCEKSNSSFACFKFYRNPELDYIASGIQRTLCNQLGQLSNLIVRPDLSTMQFRDTKEPPQQIAKKLSVNNIIQSSIIGSEENLQIEVSLIEAFPSEKVIWSSTFNQNWNNITSTYNEIIRRIMDGIQINILPGMRKRLPAGKAIILKY